MTAEPAHAQLPGLFERVRLVAVQAEGYVANATFDDLIGSLAAAFSELGADTDIASNQLLAGAGINLVFGAHLLAADASLPPNSIIVNLEPAQGSNFARQPHYLDLLRNFPVLDYSPRNAERLRQLTGNAHIHALPIGYTSAATRIERAAEQDIDVLFYGSINPRRQAMLDALVAAGLRVKALYGQFGAERDGWIARSKIVLNMHYYADQIHEVVRTSYLLANRKAVVSECTADTEIDEDLRAAIVGVPYEQIVAACVALAHDDERRKTVEENGFACFARRDQAALLAEALPRLSLPLPARINLGSGKAWDADRFNIDIDPKWNPDILADLAAPASARQIFFSRRFGLLRLASASFDEISAIDVLEHVPDLVTFMTRCLDLLRPGGAMRIGVPYDLSWGAWQDPTHLRAFNERSWLYYTDWHWYLGWLDARFVLTDLQMMLSPVGEGLRQQGLPNEEIFRTPRAVDSMQVVLSKRLLGDEERANAAKWFKGDAVARQPANH